MSKQSPFEWLASKLADNEKVNSTQIISKNCLLISRREGPNLTVTTTQLNIINAENIKEILETEDADFILHRSQEPFVHGDCFDYLESREKILGGFGDVIRVINQDSNWPYFPPNVSFILRILKQHTKVSQVRRLDNKRYEVTRYGLNSVTIIALDDYDLGIESIRSAFDEFGSFDAVFKSNPNGRITSSATVHANSTKIKVFSCGELLKNLNFEWS